MAIMNNKDNKGLKNHCIYTNDIIAKNVYKIIKESGIEHTHILEPSIGEGFLTKLFKDSFIYGIDIDNKGKDYCDMFYNEDFEYFNKQLKVNLVLSNPPFNGHKSRKLYPEVFLRKIVELYGKDIPIVMIVPHGVRLNVRYSSERWKWLRDNLEITSILSLPVDAFEGVLFHTEILFFNIKNIKPHYFLDLDI